MDLTDPARAVFFSGVVTAIATSQICNCLLALIDGWYGTRFESGDQIPGWPCKMCSRAFASRRLQIKQDCPRFGDGFWRLAWTIRGETR
jgi:hypothetical protein